MPLEDSLAHPELRYTTPPTWRELRLRSALERTEALVVRLLERPCPSCGHKPGEEVSRGR